MVNYEQTEKVSFHFSIGLAFSSLAIAQEENWSGVYKFSEQSAPGKPVMSFYHTLAIENRADELTVKLEGSGHYLSREFICTAKIIGHRLSIYFNSSGDNNRNDFYEINDLVEGNLLLTLERRKVKGKTVVLTFWGKFQPLIKKLPTGKIYFRKN